MAFVVKVYFDDFDAAHRFASEPVDDAVAVSDVEEES